MPTVEERVSKLELVLEEFIKNVDNAHRIIETELEKLTKAQVRTESGLERLIESQARTEAELRAFKEESERDRKALHEEMKAFKDEMKAFKDEMKDFKDEMKIFKDEMMAFREDTREENRKMNKRWGEISNKLGTIVEDIIYPALRPVIKQYFGYEPVYMAMNIRRKRGELKDEYDAIVECEDAVFLVEVKATPKKEYIDDFKENKVKKFKELFPEYKRKNLILIFASLRLEEDTVNYLTHNRIYAMAYREWEYMDILNFDAIGKTK